MLSSLRFIDLKGLATVGFYTPELDEVFVDVSLAYRAPHEVPESVLTQLPSHLTDRHSIMDFIRQPQPTVLAVIGVPGSGKTTLLRHTARVVSRNRRNHRSVPILLYLRDHAAAIVARGWVPLPDLVRSTLGRYGPDEPPGWLEQRLRDGNCVVLLDGLDEVARQEDRSHVAEWVERQTKQYPGNDFVITSRPHGYRSAAIDGAVVVQVRSFSEEQVIRFVRGWYLAVERHSAGVDDDEGVPLRATSAADDLIDRLSGAPALYDLTINPLLLTMIANVHRYRGALPGSRADLYDEICQVMLWRRQEAKKLPIGLTGDKKEALLRSLAFTMMQRKLRDLPREYVLDAIKQTLRRMSTKLTEEEFLADVSSNGILVEREAGLYSFAHLTFQEYLAAMHIRDKSLVQVLAGAVEDPWWRETILLYVARSDADPIVRASLDSGGVAALSLAFDCLAQGSELAPALRQQLNAVLDANHDEPERHRLRIGVRIARHVRPAIRTAGGGRVCVRPISASIYGLYLGDTGACPPDYSTADAEDPITGVRCGDAVDFVNWVNAITSSEPGYRLPTHADLQDAGVQRALARNRAAAAWLEPADTASHPELWMPTGAHHPNLITAPLLAHHVTEDFARSTNVLTRLLLIHSIASSASPEATLDIIRTAGLGHVLDVSQARDVDLALALDRGPTLDYGGFLPPSDIFDPAVVLAHALDVARGFIVSDAAAPLMGSALARTVSFVLGRGVGPDNLPDEFARAFFGLTHPWRHWVVSLDWLALTLPRARQNLLANEAGSWASQVAYRLEEAVAPIINRQRQLEPGAATPLRLAALCLAAEADACGAGWVGDKYRGIAASVTLLERRFRGLASAMETIVLVTD